MTASMHQSVNLCQTSAWWACSQARYVGELWALIGPNCSWSSGMLWHTTKVVSQPLPAAIVHACTSCAAACFIYSVPDHAFLEQADSMWGWWCGGGGSNDCEGGGGCERGKRSTQTLLSLTVLTNELSCEHHQAQSCDLLESMQTNGQVCRYTALGIQTAVDKQMAALNLSQP